jgi:hypothetical protein
MYCDADLRSFNKKGQIPVMFMVKHWEWPITTLVVFLYCRIPPLPLFKGDRNAMLIIHTLAVIVEKPLGVALC